MGALNDLADIKTRDAVLAIRTAKLKSEVAADAMMAEEYEVGSDTTV
jgi:hypothetical protein